MSNSDDSPKKEQPGSSLPENIAPPPPFVDLPKPDGLEEPNQQSRVNKDKKKKKKKRSKERQHPLDAYEPVRHARRGCGCFGLLFILLVAIAGAAGWMGWQLRKEFVTGRDFAWVNVKGQNLAAAPDSSTVYLGAKVFYEAPETPVEVVFAGGMWWLSGTFQEKVHFRGVKLALEPDARFLKGLQVDAVFFDPGEAEIPEDFTGRILKQE